MKKKQRGQLEEKIVDLEAKWKRALADYSNLEKRIKKGQQEFVEFSNAQLLDKLLPVLDDLEACAAHLEDEGLGLTLDKFKEVLESEGVKEIEVQGEEFGPETMDAVEIVSGPENKVAEVVLKGYFLNDKVLRPAKVRVGGRKRKK